MVARIACILYGDTVEVSLEDGTRWQGTPATYKDWYASHARSMLAQYKERRTMEAEQPQQDDIQDPSTPASVIAADATEQLAQAMPGIIDPAQFKDQVYLIVHEAMQGIINEARSKLALLTPPAAPTREARVTAISPQGYVVTLIVREETSNKLIDTLQGMQGWMESAKYTTPPAAISF